LRGDAREGDDPLIEMPIGADFGRVNGEQWAMGSIDVIDEVWARIQRHAGESFVTKTGLLFTYEVPGNYLRVVRGGDPVNRSLSRTNFARPWPSCPPMARGF
jgi:hypothetical protein